MKKDKAVSPPTKVVIRHLPSGLTEEEFLEVVNPLPEHNWFSYHVANNDYGSLGFCRAYINFSNPDDIYTFKDRFDGYVFVNGKGNESQAIVEFAPFQKLAIRDASPKRPDPRMGTIATDPDFLQFVQALDNPEPAALPGTEKMLEDLEGSSDENTKTPLVEYIEQKRLEILRKLQNRSQLDKLNTRQLERVLKREERKEYVRLRRAEKRRQRIGERGARKQAKQSHEDDFEDDYDEYEDMPRPPSRVKGLSPRTERSSSTRSLDASPRTRAKRDRKTPKKPLPEKDKHRRPDAETRLQDKEAFESAPKPDKKVFVIKRRLDTTEPSVDADPTKSLMETRPSEHRQESSGLPSKDSEGVHSTEKHHQSISEENAKCDTETNKEISAGDSITSIEDKNSSLNDRISPVSNETPPAEELSDVQGKLPDGADKSPSCDEYNNTKAPLPNTYINDLDNTQYEQASDDSENQDEASSRNSTVLSKKENNEDMTSPTETLESPERGDKEDTSALPESGPCDNESNAALRSSPVNSASGNSSDAALVIPGNAATTSGNADCGTSVEAGLRPSGNTDCAISPSAETALTTAAEAVLGPSVETALGSSAEGTFGTSIEATSSSCADAMLGSDTDANHSAQSTSTEAALGTMADKSSSSNEQPRSTESGDDSSKAGSDPRTVRKIRNKDRPAMQLYRPGQCRLSSARQKQENGNVTATKDTSSSHSSTPSPVMGGAANDLPCQSSKFSDGAKGEIDSIRGSSEGVARGKERVSRDSISSAGRGERPGVDLDAIRGSSEGGGRGKDRVARDGPSSVGRGERAAPLKKKPAKTLEFTNQRHHRGGGGGGGGRGADRGRGGRFGQAKQGGSFEGPGKLATDGDGGDAGHAKGSDAGHAKGSDAGHAKGSDGASSAAPAGVTKSQGKRYSKMRPTEK